MLNKQDNQRLTNYVSTFSIICFLGLIVGGCILLCVVANFLPLYGRRTGAIGGIYVQDVYLATKINEQGLPIDPDTRFNSETPKIYCIVTSSGMFGLAWQSGIIIRWYHDREEIATDLFDIEATVPAITTLKPPVGEQFSSGDYSVSVFVQRRLVKTIDFRIE